jgi:chromosome segregation ATPase
LETASKSIRKPPAEISSEVTTALIDDLKSELSKKKSQIDELEVKITELTKENEALNQELVEKLKKLPIDYVVPVEQPKPSVIAPQSTQPTSQTLEILCQDLQTDLNKYKRIVEKLSTEKSELEQAMERGGFQLEPEEIKTLKKENEDLKNEISQIQESLKSKQKEIDLSPQISEAEKKITDLQEQLKEKDHMITELKGSQQTQSLVPKGPMSDLVEDLQSKINKLKITIEEKNKIIEESKSS